MTFRTRRRPRYAIDRFPSELTPIARFLCFLQGDQNIANQAGAAFRSDLNNELQALATLSSGTAAPGTTYAHQLWADTTNNVLKKRNAANSGWLVIRTLDESFVLGRSSNTILGLSDRDKFIRATSNFTQTLTAAATLGDGWCCEYRIESGVSITFDPNGSENIDGATTKAVTGPSSGRIWCDGSAFYTSGFPASGGGLTLGTPQNSTSGTSIDFTGIPAGTKKIIINFNGVSTSGTSQPIVQLGDSGGAETSGYLGGVSVNSGSATVTNGFAFTVTGALAAANIYYGQMILTLLDSSTNMWSCQGQLFDDNIDLVSNMCGIKATSAVLDRVRITTAGGTDTFDAGSINIAYQ